MITQSKRRASTQAHEYDLTVNTDRQRSIKAADLATALNEAEQVRQQDDDVALWRGSRLVGAATRFGPIDLSGSKPTPRPAPPLTVPSPAALEALREYRKLWAAYQPHAFNDVWYDHEGGKALCDKMHAAEEVAIRLCLGTDARIPLEKIRHETRAYIVDDALIVVACGWSDRDRPVGSMDKCFEGHYLLIVEPAVA